MKKILIALAVSTICGGAAQAADVTVGGVVQMYVYLDQDTNEDNPEVENGDVELQLEATEKVGSQTGYVRYRLDGGMKGDFLSTGKATAGVRGGWGDLSIGTTENLSNWGQYGDDNDDHGNEFNPGHEFDKGSIGYMRDFGGIKFGLGYTPGQNATGEAGSAEQLDSIVGIGLEFSAGEYTIGFNTQDAESTLGVKGMFGAISYGLHYIDVDGAEDEIIGFKLGAKSGDIDFTLSYHEQGEDDRTRLDLAYPVAGSLLGVARFQDDFTRVGLSMEF